MSSWVLVERSMAGSQLGAGCYGAVYRGELKDNRGGIRSQGSAHAMAAMGYGYGQLGVSM